MVDVVCLEYALAARNDVLDIVTVEGNDTIVFPHVDSCVAVIFVHPKGRLTGGHVSVTAASGAVGEPESLAEMLGRMREWSGDKVERVILIGHPAWRKVADKVLAADGALKSVPCDNLCQFNDPIDIFAELGTQKLRVQKWQKKAEFDPTAIPARCGEGEWLLDAKLPSGS